jgi:prepilin-type N-terminal cleavage/methylation domain-containing protein
MRTARGFTLIEMNLVVIIVGVIALVAGSFSSLLSKAFVEIRVKNRANTLAIAAMEEIRCRKWDELAAPSSSPAVGRDAGETAGVKASFDDVDDFDGYAETPPRYMDGAEIPGLAGFSLAVEVKYVDAALAVSASPTGLKKVSVTVSKNGAAKIALHTVLSRGGGL